jgi:preprotein translocase subunit SecE
MAKKGKKARKRAERRERAKTRGDQGEPVEEQLEEQESAADEAVVKAAAAEAPRAAEKRAAKPAREEQRDNAWTRMVDFLREVDIERKKINWPAIDETWRSTWVVVLTILFLALFMGACSFGFARVAEQLFGVRQVVEQGGAQVPTSPLGAVDLDLPATGTGGGGTEKTPEGE